jgi:hypothetical protein
VTDSREIIKQFLFSQKEKKLVEVLIDSKHFKDGDFGANLFFCVFCVLEFQVDIVQSVYFEILFCWFQQS